VEHAQNYVLYVMNIHCVTYYSNGCQDSAVWITNFGSWNYIECVEFFRGCDRHHLDAVVNISMEWDMDIT